MDLGFSSVPLVVWTQAIVGRGQEGVAAIREKRQGSVCMYFEEVSGVLLMD